MNEAGYFPSGKEKLNWCVKKKEKPTHGVVNYLVAVVIVQRGEAGVGG